MTGINYAIAAGWLVSGGRRVRLDQVVSYFVGSGGFVRLVLVSGHVVDVWAGGSESRPEGVSIEQLADGLTRALDRHFRPEVAG
jgi:hypothetical protein